VIAFTSLLWIWKGEAAGRWHFLTVPEEQSDKIRGHGLGQRSGFGSVRVEARIGAVAWRTSVFPQKTGDYLLPVKAEVRRKAGIAAGDEVTVTLDLV
jgi:hypothetical protein